MKTKKPKKNTKLLDAIEETKKDLDNIPNISEPFDYNKQLDDEISTLNNEIHEKLINEILTIKKAIDNGFKIPKQFNLIFDFSDLQSWKIYILKSQIIFETIFGFKQMILIANIKETLIIGDYLPQCRNILRLTDDGVNLIEEWYNNFWSIYDHSVEYNKNFENEVIVKKIKRIEILNQLFRLLRYSYRFFPKGK